jgi:hypothetical protein
MTSSLKTDLLRFVAAQMCLAVALQLGCVSPSQAVLPAYLGFDRNEYPGDANLKALRQIFSYSGFWLNNPPGSNHNSWTGKRKILQDAGFGFLVVFAGRTDAQIKSAKDAVKLGIADAAAAISMARGEGFPSQTIIFLDQEEGGRLLPEQRSYLHAWVDGVNSAEFRAGVYCSGIPSKETSGATIVTADDIRKNAGARKIAYWVFNDACPPSPGCAFPKKPPSTVFSGVWFAEVWQFAQSPRRPDFSRGCTVNYSKDGNCYPPGTELTQHVHVDLDAAASPDPSHGKTRD